MLSGGLDSTGLLFKILEESKNEEDTLVYGHYVNLNNFYDHGKAEHIAVKHIVDYALNNYDNFRFKSSSFEYKPHAYKTSECNIVYGFVMAIFTQDIILDIIHRKNQIPYVRVYQTVDNSEYNNLDWTQRWETQKKVFEASFHEYILKNNVPIPEIELPFIDLDRKQIHKYIPDELKDKTWSCRCPNKVGDECSSCGECESCLENKRNKHKC
jgi:hypothetical protein